MKQQQTFDLGPSEKGPVECLGMTFDSDDARRNYFLGRLKEKLQEPEFRKTPGFPKGTDEDILRMSDPPYYTACPNPFLAQFVRFYGRPYEPNEDYHREPFAVDTSSGKTDLVYKAHSYHTKVPHLAIIPSLEHYTQPGDIILDGFSGSGMTATAAVALNSDANGSRYTVLNDLGPAATFISANYNIPFDTEKFRTAARALLDSIEQELGWMYETICQDSTERARIDYVVWSQVFSCPSCGTEIKFLDEALDTGTSRIKSKFPCPSCSSELTKDDLGRVMETLYDPYLDETFQRVKFSPVTVAYSRDGSRYEKPVDDNDRAVLARIRGFNNPYWVPTSPLPLDAMYHGSRLGPKGITHIHRLFLDRPLILLSALWAKADALPDQRIRNQMLFFVEQAIPGMSMMNRYRPTGYSQVSQYMTGVYYIGSQISETSPWYNLRGKLDRLVQAFVRLANNTPTVSVSTGSCTALPLPDASIDYIFTDPPFGENIFYADLNLLVEAWHKVSTSVDQEAIVDKPKRKSLDTYQGLMASAFREYFRVCKPGRWITVVFSNSSNAVWRAIQEAMGRAGFVIADVRTLDKQQGSYRQVTSSAVKQDLVISAYKPAEAMTTRFTLEAGSPESAWTFVDQHLSNVPQFVSRGGESEVIVERIAQTLLDRMIAFHVQRGVAVPLSAAEFFRGLEQRYTKRDGMYFLHEQVLEYDTKRAKVESVVQLSFMVTDEASAILWVRGELERKPQSFQDLNPVFMREIQTWAGHEKTVELKDILGDNFLRYDGTGPVPPQIHTYLSSNYKDMRGLAKDDPVLNAKAVDRWYVPDPNKQADLDQLRIRRLLKEFLDYKESKQKKLKLFRTEAVRAGFKAAYDQKDYRTIIDVARKLPDPVIQEDEKLLMYRDVASMRLGED